MDKLLGSLMMFLLIAIILTTIYLMIHGES